MNSSGIRPLYSAILTQRLDALRDQLSRILAGRPTFLWEVGCGHGHFLTAYAAAHPETMCIGVDLVGERIERATKKRDRAGLTNLHYVRADARLFLEAIPSHSRIGDVFMLFPDPWPKARHRKHRVLQDGFLNGIAAHAADESRLFFRTDHRPYFNEAAAAVTASSYWEPVDAPWPFEFETVFQSRAERHDSLIARRRMGVP